MPYYAVKRGKAPGVYTTWDEAKKQIYGYKAPVFKRFETMEDAKEFVGSDPKPQSITQFFPTQDPEENDKTLICFTDGSAINNGQPNAKASYAVVWPYHGEYNSGGPVFPATNNRGEYTALIRAFEQAMIIDPLSLKTLIVYTDSMLMINSLTKWLPGWKRAGYKKSDGETIANLDLVKELETHMQQRSVVLRHVRSHQKTETWESRYNNLVDQLARASIP